MAGKAGSLSWWLPVKMDDADRVRKKITAPDTDKWNKQMYRVRVFDEVIYDTDPTSPTCSLARTDHLAHRFQPRAFRTSKDLREPKNLGKCDRQLFEKLKALKAVGRTKKTKRYLTKPEVNGVMARRDKIVATFQTLIAEKGENEVLYCTSPSEAHLHPIHPDSRMINRKKTPADSIPVDLGPMVLMALTLR